MPEPIEDLPEQEEPEVIPEKEEKEEPQPIIEGTQEAAPVEDEVDETPDSETLKAEIENLRKQREKAKKDAAYWRQQKAEARADYFKGRGREEGEPSQPVKAVDVGPVPQPDAFDDYNKYIDALTDYKVNKAKAEWQREFKAEKSQSTAQERQQLLDTKLLEGYEKYPDFEDVALDNRKSYITPMIREILIDCDRTADLAYYLGNNPVEGVKISKMTPIQAARTIANIERDIIANESPVKHPKPTATSAPAPIKPIGSKGKVSKDPNSMSQKEYNEWRESQGARRF